MADNPFLDRLVARFDREPSRIFAEIWMGDRREVLTWGELGARARAFASAYLRGGLEPGDVVFIILRHGVDLYPSYLGAMLAGGVPSFLPFPSAKQDPDLYWSSQLAVFRRTDARFLVTYGELATAVRQRTDGVPQVLDVDDIGNVGPTNTQMARDESAVALLQHSSGTTGLKKGVALTFRAIRLQLDAYAERLRLDPVSAVIASWLPLYHDMGLIACFMLPAYHGIKLVSLDAFEWTARPALLLDAIEACRATHAWLPNFALAHLARAVSRKRTYDLGSLEVVVGCSEPNKPAIFEMFATRFAGDGLRARLQACYAMAESVFAISQTEPGAPARPIDVSIAGGAIEVVQTSSASRQLLSNGRPLPGVEVQILRDGMWAGAKQSGEICVRAPFLFDGYFNDPEATAAAFVEGFFRTGDIGFLHEKEVYVLGRRKELIIVNGRNFFANDIEDVVNSVAGVKRGRCVAFGLYTPTFGAEQIVIVAERDSDGTAAKVTPGAISEALNAGIGTAPGDVRVVEPGWLVKTTSGKLSRAENIGKYMAAFRPDLGLHESPEGVPS